MTLAEHYESLYKEQKRAPSVRTVVNLLTEVMARLLLIQTAYSDFAAQRTDAVNFPYSEIETTVAKIDELIALATVNLDAPWDLVVTLRDELRGLRNLRLIKEIFTSRALVAETVDNVFLFGSRSRKGYSVQWGDTLRGVATRFLHDGTRWMEIAALNNLDYPYIVNRVEDIPPAANVAVPGNVITLPLDAQDSNNQVVGSVPTDYGTLLGTDIFLSESGEFQLDAVGDVRLVTGGDNLAQAVRHRLIVPKGQLPLHPEYGSELELYIGKEATPANVQQASLEARRTVRQDPRITMIDALTTAFATTTLTATLTARVIGNESPQQLNLVIPR